MKLKHAWVWEMFSTESDADRASAVSTRLARVAATLPALQAARHSADYEHRARFPKATAVAHVERADLAVRALGAGRDDPSMQRFYAVLLARASRFRD